MITLRVTGESPCSVSHFARPFAGDQVISAPAVLATGVPSRPRWGADGTLVSHMTGRQPCGTTHACIPSLRGRTSLRILPGTAPPCLARHACSVSIIFD